VCSENPMEAGKDIDLSLLLRPECPEGWLLKGRVLQKVAAWSEAADAFTAASQVLVLRATVVSRGARSISVV
jgi:hypothetical protein